MLSSVEQAFVGREEIRAPLKTPAWEAMITVATYEFKWDKKNVKLKYRANLFKHLFFVLFFGLLLHGLSVLLMIFYKYYCTDLGLQLRDPAPLNGLSLWTC